MGFYFIGNRSQVQRERTLTSSRIIPLIIGNVSMATVATQSYRVSRMRLLGISFFQIEGNSWHELIYINTLYSNRGP